MAKSGNKCSEGGSEHDFQPRFDEFNARYGPDVGELVAGDRVYVRDVCTRCGETIERQRDNYEAVSKGDFRVEQEIRRRAGAGGAFDCGYTHP